MEDEVIGFIDWEGIFHKCSYGKHSELAFNLAKKLLKDDSYSAEKKIEYGLVKISRSCFMITSDMYYCYLPKVINEKQKDTLKSIIVENKLPQLTSAIQEALEKRDDYPDILEEKIDVMSLKNVSYMTDECDYGTIGSSIHWIHENSKE